MSGLVVSDPLALVAIEAGLVKPPLADAAAEGDSKLDVAQRAAVIGEPVPIVFCRRDEGDGTGGVLISPPATEARFSNSLITNAVTARYHLVLSEGRIGNAQVRDVFQRSCRVGTHSQTYDRRAGTWVPGNVITEVEGFTKPECPYHCGSIGTYTGMSTMSFQVTIPDGFDYWNRQVHVFVRNGMEVPRLIEGTVGSSCNYADLVQWGFINCAKLKPAQIDSTSMLTAAEFLAANKFNCDIRITESENLGDFIARLAPYFLLTETRNSGRRGLRPLLPINEDGTIQVTPVSWVFTFTEDQILPDQFEISYVAQADRRPICVQAVWRQQLTDDFGIIRTSEVRYEGEAVDGPYEQHDLSAFCTREDHAVKIAAYIRARRKFVTHLIRLTCRAMDLPTLEAGDIIRVQLERRTTAASSSSHDFLYQIDRIATAATGETSIEATHFPIDGLGRSMVAVAVANASGNGILLTSNKTGVGCDINSSTDETVPAETFTAADPVDAEVLVELPYLIDPSGNDPSGNDPSGNGGGGTGGVTSQDSSRGPGYGAGEASPEEVVQDPSGCVGPDADLYFHSVDWSGNTLITQLRISPAGLAPDPSLNDLYATIQSGDVYAIDTSGNVISPDPGGLPSLSFSGLIASPWDESIPPLPPSNYIFQGEFQIGFQDGDFPTQGSGIARYVMPVTITDTSGGFCDVTPLNSAIVEFEAREQQDASGQPFIAFVNLEGNPMGVRDFGYNNYDDDDQIFTLNLQAANEYTGYLFMWTSSSSAHEAAKAQVLNFISNEGYGYAPGHGYGNGISAIDPYDDYPEPESIAWQTVTVITVYEPAPEDSTSITISAPVGGGSEFFPILMYGFIGGPTKFHAGLNAWGEQDYGMEFTTSWPEATV